MDCERCNSGMACYHGEYYCPDCTRYEVEQADDEAHVLHLVQLAQPGPDSGPVDDSEIPW